MTTQNDQSTPPQANQTLCKSLFTPANLALLEFIHDTGPETIADSLREIHDLLLYYSDWPISVKEKSVLLDVKMMAEMVDGIWRMEK